MTHRLSSLVLSFVLIVALTGALTGCDDTDPSPITLGGPSCNVADPVEVDFTFPVYDADDVTDGKIVITSNRADNLSSVLDGFGGFTRTDVLDAEVTEVTMERLTLGGALRVQPKVFGYLGSVNVYYGDDPDGQLIAGQTPVADDPVITLDNLNTDVTGIVQGSARPITLELEVDDPGSIGSGGDEVAITVCYRINVEG
ncbi:MAG: hypothetical protein PPP56_04545 [Longimonas sp.]|uniref:hypothetical protein n=1 Tax=Longimonas sp. TaxID=2039626 RepID=UPI0033645209